MIKLATMRNLMILSLALWQGLMLANSLDAEQILRSLIEARGEPRTDYPGIQILDRVKSIAAYSPQKNLIILEEKALETCEMLGDQAEDALAFLISHELTHFFQHQLWQRNQDQIAFFATRERLEAVKSFEVEADTYGAFLCFLAGYDYHEVAPRIIQALYESYQIDASALAQYPAPEERMILTQSVCEQVADYALIFESARTLSHFGAYRWSQALTNYLLDYLDFQEIYQNSGANQLKWLLSNQGSSIHFPIQFKKSLSLRGGLEYSADSLLRLAEANTVKAIEKNPADHSTFINLACIHLIKNDLSAYEHLVEQLTSVSQSLQTEEQLAVLHGIYLFKKNEKNVAMRHFSRMRSKTSDAWIKSICARNLAFLRDKEMEDVRNPSRGNHYFPERNSDKNSVREKIIDRSDPLFPKKVLISKNENIWQLEFTDGNQRIILWKMPHSQLDVDDVDNALITRRGTERSRWLIQGI